MAQTSPAKPLGAESSRLEATYRVRFDESGPDGLLPASGFLRYAQDLAWRHSAGLGFDRGWYAAHGLSWLIRAIELDVVDAVQYGDELQVSTEVVGFRRVWARRRSEFSRSGDQRPLALATIDWVLLNEGGQPVRVPSVIADRFETEARSVFTPLRVPLPASPSEAHVAEFPVRRRELDPMAHVNNAAYLDYFDELMLAAGHADEPSRLPRRYGVEYVSPAEQGALLHSRLWHTERSWCLRLESPAGRELVRARLESELADWVGA